MKNLVMVGLMLVALNSWSYEKKNPYINPVNPSFGTISTTGDGTIGKDLYVVNNSSVAQTAMSKYLVVNGTMAVMGGCVLDGVVRIYSTTSNSAKFGIETDDVSKNGYITGTQYDTSDEPEGFFMIGSFADSGFNKVYFGGGGGAYNAATEMRFYGAPDTTTRTGTVRMKLDSANSTLYLDPAGTTVNMSTLTANGLAMGVPMVLPSRTIAELGADTPTYVGEMFFCSDSVPPSIYVSTTTGLAGFGKISLGNID